MCALHQCGPRLGNASRQISQGLGNSRLRSLGTHCYEGDMTTGPRVTRRTVGRAQQAIGRRTNTRSQQRALRDAGLTTATGQLRRTGQARQLTPSELRQRTRARANARNAGTAAGRRQTNSIIAQARRQDRGRAGRQAQLAAARAIAR